MPTPSFESSVERLRSLGGRGIGGASRAELLEFEWGLGRAVPRELGAWLRVCNGVCVHRRCFLGLRPMRDAPAIGRIMSVGWPNASWIPVARDDFGNYYVMIPDHHPELHPIVFMDAAAGVVEHVASSGLSAFVPAFIQVMADEGDWPCDKDRLCGDDPALLQVRGYPFPWETA